MKNVVPKLEAVQKILIFFHDNYIDLLKLGCTLSNLANPVYTNLKIVSFIPSRRQTKTGWKKIKKMMLVALLLFLHAQQLSTKILFEMVRTYANQLLQFISANYNHIRNVNLCPLVFICVGISIHTSTKKKFRSFENMVTCFSRGTRPEFEIENFYSTHRQKKIDCFSVNGFCSHCNTLFEANGCFYHFCPCQHLQASLTEDDTECGSKGIELEKLRRSYIQEKVFTDLEVWESERWRLCKITPNGKQHVRKNISHRRSLTDYQLLEETTNGKMI